MELDLEEVRLLFGNLVVLPETKKTTETDNSVDTQLKTTKENLERSSETPPSFVKEDKPEYVHKIPLGIISNEQLKESYLAKNSNFGKILIALNLQHLTSQIQFSSNKLDSLNKYECLWCIGLNIADEKLIRNLNHSNLLISPDVDSLSSNDEKKQMWSDLKEFTSSNLDFFSKK